MAINLFGRQAAFELGDDVGEDDADQLDIPIHAFDLIVADECHRGYTSAELRLWGNNLDPSDPTRVALPAPSAAPPRRISPTWSTATNTSAPSAKASSSISTPSP